MATFALQSWLVCSILRVLSLQLGASVVTVDDGFPVRSICSIFVVYRSALIPAYPRSVSIIQNTHILTQAHARTRHGVFDTCHQHVVLLALVRLLRSQLSYAGLLYIKLTSFPVSTECVHEACQSIKDTRKYNHAKINFETGAFGAGLTTQYNL